MALTPTRTSSSSGPPSTSWEHGDSRSSKHLQPPDPIASPAPSAPTAPPEAPTPSAEPAAEAEAPAAAPAVDVIPAPVVPEGPPRKVVTADGISITETSDGRVILKTTARWGEEIDTTYTDCGYYTKAIPVLEGQVAPEHAKLLSRVCAKAKP